MAYTLSSSEKCRQRISGQFEKSSTFRGALVDNSLGCTDFRTIGPLRFDHCVALESCGTSVKAGNCRNGIHAQCVIDIAIHPRIQLNRIHELSIGCVVETLVNDSLSVDSQRIISLEDQGAHGPCDRTSFDRECDHSIKAFLRQMSS